MELVGLVGLDGASFGTQMEGHLDGVVDGKWEKDPLDLGNISFLKEMNHLNQPTILRGYSVRVDTCSTEGQLLHLNLSRSWRSGGHFFLAFLLVFVIKKVESWKPRFVARDRT